jgi:hypothetical protein
LLSIGDIGSNGRKSSSDLLNAKEAEDKIEEELTKIKQQLDETGLHLMFSMKHDMPNEWALMKEGKEATIKIDELRLPYFARFIAKTDQFASVQFAAKGVENLAVKIKTATPHHAFTIFPQLSTNHFVAKVGNVGSF